MNDLLQLRPGSVEWREIEGELVGLQTGNATYFSVNPSGTLPTCTNASNPVCGPQRSGRK